MPGPITNASKKLHSIKYREQNESFREAINRVAGGLADNPVHFQVFRDVLMNMRFLPAGRVQSAIGSSRNVTPYNCYVASTIKDSMIEGDGSIMRVAAEAAATMRMGGGIGYDFSTLRPRGDLIAKLQSYSSGPVSFMNIFNSICHTIASSGHRRGAQMAVLRVDHPDIEEYVRCKQPETTTQDLWDHVESLPEGPERQALFGVLQATLPRTGFNVSVGITDKFMEHLASGKPFPLEFGGKTYKTIDPKSLWDTIMRSTWDWAEPGVLFIDTINKMNSLSYCETIAATNPCGEQPLPPNGACLLGSFNLVKYVSGGVFNWEQLKADIPHVVRAMDNVVDRAIYPLKAQQTEAQNKRRMGLGVTGLANAAEATVGPYGSPEFLDFEARVLQIIAEGSYQASSDLAAEKGSFPLFDAEKYLNGGFASTLSDDTQHKIRKQGLRNSHLTSIAPTGTISMCADNVSSGIEPVFAYSMDRVVQNQDGPTVETIYDYGKQFLGVEGKRCDDVTISEHLDVLVIASQNVDSAVSKTCNVPSDVDWESFKQVYVSAWERGCKGATTFRLGGKRFGILKSNDENDEGKSCTIDPKTGQRDCS